MGIRHSGLSQTYSQLGDVASCTDTNIRKVSRQPANPSMPKYTAWTAREVHPRRTSAIQTVNINVKTSQQTNIGERYQGVGARTAFSGGKSARTCTDFTSGRPPTVASANWLSITTGAKAISRRDSG